MDNLKKLRLLRGIRQKDIADMLGVERTTYNRYETGASEPSYQILIKLADIFGTSTDEILGHAVGTCKPGRDIANIELTKKASFLNESGIEELMHYADYLATQSRYQKDTSTEQAI